VEASSNTLAFRMEDQQSEEPVFISSNGELLAHISGHKLTIKTVQTFHVIETFTCDGVIGVSVKRILSV
jgi:hypothetical protein